MADDEAQISQNEIEDLLRQAKDGGKPAPPAAASAKPPAGEDQSLSQTDIESLLASKPAGTTPTRPAAPAGGQSPPPPTPAPAPAPQASAGGAASRAAANSQGVESPIPQADIELLLSHAERALASVEAPHNVDLPAGIGTFRFEDFTGAPPSTEAATIELVRDVEMDLKIELGRTHMYLEDVLKLKRGSVVPLDKLAGDPVDIYVNGRLIARGEVLVLNDSFCVRVAELISSETTAAAG
jgi:flagellar motor switch protein FliN